MLEDMWQTLMKMAGVKEAKINTCTWNWLFFSLHMVHIYSFQTVSNNDNDQNSVPQTAFFIHRTKALLAEEREITYWHPSNR